MSDEGPLTGYRIVELAANVTAPIAAAWLGDQGADVIKVEPPIGDTMRNASAIREDVPGLSAIFATMNRNKRSLKVDMKQPGVIDALKKLISTADVVVQNYRPGVIDRLGLGYEELKKIKPELIMVSVSGFGDAGPYADYKAYDTVIQGLSGLPMEQCDSVTGEPNQLKTAICDKVTGLMVFQAITAALLGRARTGKGQHVKVNMLNSILAFVWPDNMANYTWLGDGVKPTGSATDLRLIYATKDHFIIALSVTNADWKALCTAIGRLELIEDPRFRDISDRMRNLKEQYAELKDTFRQKTTEEWLKILREHDVVCSPILTPANLHLDPHIASGGFIQELEHPHSGSYRQAVHPINFGGMDTGVRRHAPALGEHTEEILREAGLSSTDIAELRRVGGIE